MSELKVNQDNIECSFLYEGDPSYFQGFGTAYTDYNHSILGCGDTVLEALENILEQYYNYHKEYTLNIGDINLGDLLESYGMEKNDPLLTKSFYDECISEDPDLECDDFNGLIYMGLRYK